MPDRNDTRDLVRRCLENPGRELGNDAWSELFERHRWRLELGIRRAMRRGGGGTTDPELLADLLQEAFCRLLEEGGQRLRDFHGTTEAELGAFLARLAERTTIDTLRRSSAAKRGARSFHHSLGAGTASFHATEPWEPLLPTAANPEQKVLGAERLRTLFGEIREACGGPTADRNLRIVRLAVLEGWTSKEIAATLGGLVPSTIDSTLSRIRRRLAARRAEARPVDRTPGRSRRLESRHEASRRLEHRKPTRSRRRVPRRPLSAAL